MVILNSSKKIILQNQVFKHQLNLDNQQFFNDLIDDKSNDNLEKVLDEAIQEHQNCTLNFNDQNVG